MSQERDPRRLNKTITCATAMQSANAPRLPAGCNEESDQHLAPCEGVQGPDTRSSLLSVRLTTLHHLHTVSCRPVAGAADS
jgi:hypothetical protein